jgi:ABC-type spermidine/putrescine transport system permease subunit II
VSSDPLRAVPGRAGGHDGSWRRRWAARLLAVLAAAPLVVLPVRALAETWRAPSLLPQTWSTRGFAVLGASGTRAGEAVTNSLVVALGTVLVALLLGWPAARSLAAAPRGRRLVATVVLALPLLVSPFATGVGLTEWFIRIGLTDTIVGLVLAHLVYVLPYVVLLLAPAFSHGVDDLEEAAAVLGAQQRAASPWWWRRRSHLPSAPRCCSGSSCRGRSTGPHSRSAPASPCCRSCCCPSSAGTRRSRPR